MSTRSTLARIVILSAVVTLAAGGIARPEPAAAQNAEPPACRLAVETGRYICSPFLAFWDANAGVELLGLPLTDQFDASSSLAAPTVQYFERQRLEFQPHESDDEGTLTLGRLGVEVLTARGRNWKSFPTADPQQDFYFPETRHAIDPLFQDFWTGHGLDLGDPGISFRESLALFGYPISELMIETNSSLDQVVVQWYERARFEFHPRNAPGNRVQLGRLGAELPFTEPTPRVALELVAEGLTAPVALLPAPDASNHLYIVDQIGLVHIMAPDGLLLSRPFLDLRARMVVPSPGYDERGLLGLAFHPDYATNRLLYVYYSAPLRPTAPDDWNHTGRISEFRTSAEDPLVVDLATERVLLEFDEPHWAHNGGAIAFGPDGYLYIGLGDGGHGGDTGLGHVDDWYPVNRGGNGQDIETNLLGSILRIDVDSADGYAIPDDNPFVGRPGLDEIWAYGLRNPFRFSFDLAGDGRLFVGDVGQDRWEEVNIVTAGGNYGWNVMEGTHCYYNVEPPPPGPCPAVDPTGNPLVPPVIEFANTGGPDGGPGRAVIGGYVYRGSQHISLYGHYLFGSWSQSWETPSGRIFFARQPPGGFGQWVYHALEIEGTVDGALDHYLLGFGQDGAGEIYVFTSDRLGPSGTTGKVYRLAG